MNKRHQGGVENYNSDFLECREGHEWHWVTDWKLLYSPDRTRLLEFERLKQCGRCKTFVKRKFDGQTGKVIPNRARYDYPDGYLSPEGKHNKIDAGQARLEMLRRAGYIN